MFANEDEGFQELFDRLLAYSSTKQSINMPMDGLGVTSKLRNVGNRQKIRMHQAQHCG